MRSQAVKSLFRRCARLLAASALAAAGVLTAGAPASAETLAVVELRPQHVTGMCLDVAHASLAHAAPVVQGSCRGFANQRWWLKPVPGTLGVYEIHALHSGLCLDVAHKSQAHAAPVVQGYCSGETNQQWRQLGGNGVFVYQAVHSGKCLDVAHLSPNHGAPVVQGNCSGAANQRWLKLQVGTINV